MNSIKRAYSTLMKAYGPQGWWPVTDAGEKRPTYSMNTMHSLSSMQKGIVGLNLCAKDAC